MAVLTTTLTTLVLLVLCLCAPAAAQKKQEPKRQIEIESLEGFRTEGGVANIIEGSATYLHLDGSAPLKPGQEFKTNDEIQVGENSRVEILLNPGSYLRLYSNSRIRFLDLSPDNWKLKLLRGSAVIEILIEPFEPGDLSFGDVRNRLTYYQPITVLTPDAEFVTARGGLYRCDVNSDGRSFLRVARGVAVVAGDLVKEDMSTALGDRVPVIRRFDKKREDEIDLWSRKRAGELVALNKALRNTDWHTKLRRNRNSSFTIKYDERSERLKELLIVSATVGIVGYVESAAVVQSVEGEWVPLVKDAELNNGDRIKTGPDSRVEIRVFPECYLMIAQDTEIIYGSDDDGAVTIRVLKGSAILTSRIPQKDGVVVSFLAGDSKIQILQLGFYRLNVQPTRESDFLVYEGLVKVDGVDVKSGERAILFTPRLNIAHTRRMDLDAFELWSRKRSAMLFPRPDSSRRHVVKPSMATRRVSLTGLWYLDATTGAHTFVPGSREFSSPYGGRYSIGFEGRFHR